MHDKSKKQAANRAHYLKGKKRQEAALLRFDSGDLKIFDDAKEVTGLTRSAFAKLYLLPLGSALAARLHDIEKARSARGISMETFALHAFDLALAPTTNASPPDDCSAADEFDQLFGAPD